MHIHTILYIYTHTHTYTYPSLSLYIYIYTHMFTYVYTHTYICTSSLSVGESCLWAVARERLCAEGPLFNTTSTACWISHRASSWRDPKGGLAKGGSAICVFFPSRSREWLGSVNFDQDLPMFTAIHKMPDEFPPFTKTINAETHKARQQSSSNPPLC